MTDYSELIELIEFENENSSLDFKAIQYKKDLNEAFLKDIISLANSLTKNNRFIIIGVKHSANGERELLGINDDFIDDATYQQLVESNIEPSIGFKYFPFKHKEKLFGIFHITECSNPPYMMKKNNGKLKLGESFVRKGSSQNRLTRKDIDIYTIQRKVDISNDISISFSEKDFITDLQVKRKEFEFPSTLIKKKIESIILKKESLNSPLNDFTIHPINPFSFIPYENRSLEELRLNLNTVSQDYSNNDKYYFYEENAYKINFYIHNGSTEFLDNVSIKITAQKTEQFIIREHIYVKPKKSTPLVKSEPRAATWEELKYPSVELKDDEYIIYSELDHVKHHLPTEVLSVPLRIAAFSKQKTSIKFHIKVFAKNLEKPITKVLQLIIPEQL
ncbi:Putative DNA-binding domain-containing protein [Chryseobacterium ureilyticum]|uniref:Putative DNA-binding domain-containing protein n=1 Tax=Chryseobacterium ureilyticum TaxID=373668 RepID=A0A1N7L4V1_9FLAO|nr:ATP-binding protein [Chryseobacterium ureilyticum]SIS68895.1 Putative DNA-binding domain-containing protein [Chryseobacterium ureilyticum]